MKISISDFTSHWESNSNLIGPVSHAWFATFPVSKQWMTSQMRQLHSMTFTVTSSIVWRQACTKSHVTYRLYKVLLIEWWNTGKTGCHNKYKKCNFKKYWQDIVLRMLPFGSLKELGASCKSCSSDECTEASGGSSSSSSQSARSFWRILMWSVSSS